MPTFTRGETLGISAWWIFPASGMQIEFSRIGRVLLLCLSIQKKHKKAKKNDYPEIIITSNIWFSAFSRGYVKKTINSAHPQNYALCLHNLCRIANREEQGKKNQDLLKQYPHTFYYLAEVLVATLRLLIIKFGSSWIEIVELFCNHWSNSVILMRDWDHLGSDGLKIKFQPKSWKQKHHTAAQCE